MNADQGREVSLKDLVDESAVDQINRKLDALHCNHVSDGEEAQLAAVVYMQNDAGAAANFIPLGVAGLALIVSAATSLALLGVSILLIVIYFGAAAFTNRDKRASSVARAVMERRLDLGRPLFDAGVLESDDREGREGSAEPKTERQVVPTEETPQG